MKKLFSGILAAGILGAMHSANADPKQDAQDILDHVKEHPDESPSTPYKSKSDKFNAGRITDWEWLMAHPEKNADDIDKQDPEYQIKLTANETLSPAELEQKKDEVWKDFSTMRNHQNEDDQIGQQGSPKPSDPPPDFPPPLEQPIHAINSRPGYMNGISPDLSVTFKSGSGNDNKKGRGNGNSTIGIAPGSGSSVGGNGNNGNGSSSPINNGGGGNGGSNGNNANWYVSQACPIFHQTALTYYQNYRADQQTTVNLLAQSIATADPNTAALNRIILSGLQTGKSAQQIGDDLCNYYAQHLSQFVGNIGTGSGTYKPAASQPQTVTQPTPVAMPGY